LPSSKSYRWRFPKFVIGFLIASAIVTVVSHGYSYADYKKALQPALVAPLQALRTWAFTDGICRLHDRYLAPTCSCAAHEIET
jgi:hypothetical protein